MKDETIQLPIKHCLADGLDRAGEGSTSSSDALYLILSAFEDLSKGQKEKLIDECVKVYGIHDDGPEAEGEFRAHIASAISY